MDYLDRKVKITIKLQKGYLDTLAKTAIKLPK